MAKLPIDKKMTADGNIVNDLTKTGKARKQQHGSPSRYKYGCRCQDCRDSVAAYASKRKKSMFEITLEFKEDDFDLYAEIAKHDNMRGFVMDVLRKNVKVNHDHC